MFGIITLEIIRCSSRSTNSMDALNYAADLSISMLQAEEMGLEDVFLHTKHLAQRLEAIHIQKEEFLALKAMALVNAGEYAATSSQFPKSLSSTRCTPRTGNRSRAFPGSTYQTSTSFLHSVPN